MRDENYNENYDDECEENPSDWSRCHVDQYGSVYEDTGDTNMFVCKITMLSFAERIIVRANPRSAQ